MAAAMIAVVFAAGMEFPLSAHSVQNNRTAMIIV
jgi:hypothetical protein